MIHLKKTQMKISSPSSLAKSASCGETKVGPSGETPQEECPETRREKTKAPSFFMSAKILNISSLNV